MPTPYKPTWAAYEKDANNPHDANKALKASDMFVAERDKELKTSQKARTWEADRKKSLYKDKPAYLKAQKKAKEEKLTAPLKKLKELGSFDGSIKPMPGYIIVDVEIQESQTQTGIILPESQQAPNTGIVVEISNELFLSGAYIPCPVKVGDKILFKRMAGQFGSPGAELSIDGKDLRLMRWHTNPIDSDILGVIYE